MTILAIVCRLSAKSLLDVILWKPWIGTQSCHAQHNQYTIALFV